MVSRKGAHGERAVQFGKRKAIVQAGLRRLRLVQETSKLSDDGIKIVPDYMRTFIAPFDKIVKGTGSADDKYYLCVIPCNGFQEGGVAFQVKFSVPQLKGDGKSAPIWVGFPFNPIPAVSAIQWMSVNGRLLFGCRKTDAEVVYNMEMQNFLPKRTWYYHSEIVAGLLRRGVKYKYLKLSDRLEELLKCRNDTKNYSVGDSDNDLIKRIDAAVDEAKMDDEWRRAYMTYQARIWDAEDVGGERKAKETVMRMYKRGDFPADIADMVGYAVEVIEKWLRMENTYIYERGRTWVLLFIRTYQKA